MASQGAHDRRFGLDPMTIPLDQDCAHLPSTWKCSVEGSPYIIPDFKASLRAQLQLCLRTVGLSTCEVTKASILLSDTLSRKIRKWVGPSLKTRESRPHLSL